ncbi:MAG: type II secretion system protein N [Candidatus Accumulibacter sp.]|jgi:hypothetical protein|nr:type II secretion system protein N [Accumulibacter sp.]
MKRRLPAGRRTLPFAAGVFILALLVRLPASFATLLLPPEIQLREVEGTFWNGRASALGIDGRLLQEQLSWNFLPRALLEAKLAWAVGGRLSDQNSRLELAIHPGSVELREVSLVLPLEPLAALHPRLKPAQLGAVLRVSAKSLNLDGRSPMAATVAVEHLFTPLSPQGELGSYRLDGKSDGAGRGDWQIATVSGALRVSGKGTFDIGRAQAGGQLTLTPQSPIPGLSPLLASLPRAGEGYSLSF